MKGFSSIGVESGKVGGSEGFYVFSGREGYGTGKCHLNKVLGNIKRDRRGGIEDFW